MPLIALAVVITLAVVIVIIAGTWFAILRGLNRDRGWQVGRPGEESALRSAASPPANELAHAKDGNAARTWDPEL